MRDFIAFTHINNNNKLLCVCGVSLKRGTGSEERVTRNEEQGNEHGERKKTKNGNKAENWK